MALPVLEKVLGIAGPAFIRRLPKRSDWGGPGDAIDQRVANAVTEGFFKRDTSPFSLWRVTTDEELRRAALALNSTTQSRSQKVEMVAFRPEELQQVGIVAAAEQQKPGNSLCPWANRLHYDLEATRQQLEALCRLAMEAGRSAGRCTEGDMNTVLDSAKKEQCHAALDHSPGCLVEHC